MRRRHLIALLGAAVAWPPAARAQRSEGTRRIAIVVYKSPATTAQVAAFRGTLRSLGWAEGENLRIAYYEIDLDQGSIREAVKASVTSDPEVILAGGFAGTVRDAVRLADRRTPIVGVNLSDPVGSGLAMSLAHPQTTVTGFASIDPSMTGKWLQLLKEIEPATRRAVLLFNPDTAPLMGQLLLDPFIAAGRALGVDVDQVLVHEITEIEPALAQRGAEPNIGLVVPADPFMTRHSDDIVALAGRLRLPAIYPDRAFVMQGGLISYGIDTIALFQRAASYVDRILRGAKPGDLPIQLPTEFQLVISLKTAKALGLTVPQSLLARADEVIE